MDCRVLRQLMLKADGNLVCDDSNGYFINLGQVSLAPGWSISQILTGGVYAHVRRAFQAGQTPWPSICETCDLFSKAGIPRDTLDSRIRLMIEPTLHCKLACPTCKRVQEGNRRSGSWDLDPDLFSALLHSCAKQRIAVEEIQYLGWGEPLLHTGFDRLTHVAREHAPAASQEVTTTGNVEFHDGLRFAQLDRVVISCDGVRPESYATFRRQGQLSAVFQFMRQARRGFEQAPFMEWKYIVFDHNDTDEDIINAQTLAESFGLDSILFILTNSKNRSRRFDVANMHEFPIRSKIASVMPAAAMMKTSWTGVVMPETSSLGEGRFASLYLDRCTITESNMAVFEGWSLASDLSYVDSVDLIRGNRVRSRVRTQHRRMDVLAARQGAQGPDCGFLIRFPIEQIELEESFLFAVKTRTGEQTFRAHVRFKQEV
jgi:hypothetical protein